MTPLTHLTHMTQLSWLEACHSLEQSGEAYVIATVVACVGSVPREMGSKMVITQSAQFDTIGGGNLEYEVIKSARHDLKQHASSVRIERFALSADLGQCCGGAVQIMFEYFLTQVPHVTIFGAGHVSQALCTILKSLPCHTTVIDNRTNWSESIQAIGGINVIVNADPCATISTIPDDSYIVIMTQDHILDFELTRLCLEQQRFNYIGLIGSQGKSQRFRFRLNEQLSNANLAAQLICPIGHPEIKGKLPMQVALSVAAQLSTLWESAAAEPTTCKQSGWEACNQTRKFIKEH
ncbi:xanthine dehydrogenase accessory protein XdhC [Vibrio sp. RC27]